MSTEVQNQSNTTEAPKASPKDESLAVLRKGYEEEKSKRLASEAELAELKKASQAPKKKEYSDPDEDDDNEPYVDHRKLNKKMSKFSDDIKEELREEAKKIAYTMLEEEKQNVYLKANPDFQSVLTEENIQKFGDKHPAIAERMLRMPANFDRQVLLYEQIKALKPHEQPQPSIQDKIDANRRGPFYQPSGTATAPYAMQGDFSASGQKNAYTKMKELQSKLKIK